MSVNRTDGFLAPSSRIACNSAETLSTGAGGSMIASGMGSFENAVSMGLQGLGL